MTKNKDINLSFEIEKKYIVGNFENTFEKLQKDAGDFIKKEKHGFWWCNNYSGLEHILDVNEPVFQKKDVTMIKDIAEFIIPEQDFQYIRIRICNNTQYLVTLKIKKLLNNIEQNIEYEFDVDKETLIKIVNYLKDTSQIFYYNIKESYEFKKGNVKIEISKFNDLKDAFLEIEVTGNNEKELNEKLNKSLEDFSEYNIKEEPRSYMQLSKKENNNTLKNIKLSQYSRNAVKILNTYL